MIQNIDHTLDLRGTISPVTLLKVSQIFEKMASEQIMEVKIRDLDTRTDIFKILPDNTFELITKEIVKDYGLYYRILIKKK